MVKDLPCNAMDAGLIPGLGRFHMQSNLARVPQLLSLYPGARESQLLSLHTYSLCCTVRETSAIRSLCTTIREEPPLLETGERYTAAKTQHSHK